MGRKVLTYSAGLIAFYLALAWGTNFGNDVKAGAAGASTFAKTLQGR